MTLITDFLMPTSRDDTYNTSIQSYASLEDEIRKIWAQLVDEEDKLAVCLFTFSDPYCVSTTEIL
jgi:hypothetical protein